MKKLILSAIVAVMVLVSGCATGSGPAQELKLDARNMAFAPKAATVKKGQPVKLVMNNQDPVEHDWVIDSIKVTGVKVTAGHAHSKSGKTPDLHVGADPNTAGALEFTPQSAGSYVYYCSVAGHREAGMVGSLEVQ